MNKSKLVLWGETRMISHANELSENDIKNLKQWLAALDDNNHENGVIIGVDGGSISLLLQSGEIFLGFGSALGSDRATQAAKNAIDGIENILSNAAFICELVVAKDFNLEEIEEAVTETNRAAAPDTNMVFSAIKSEECKDSIVAIVLASAKECV